MRWPLPEDWPLRAQSRRVALGSVDWHIQELGEGDTLLLLHGAGGATQSWRAVAPILAKRYHVVAVDLPGQGASYARWGTRFGLDDMAKAITMLMRKKGWLPIAVVGHSAGGAIALRLAEMGVPGKTIGLNAALGKFGGIAGVLFPLTAQLLATNALAARLVSAQVGNERAVSRMLAGTGSTIDARGVELYTRLAGDPDHVHGTLRMMAHWQLDGLIARFARNPARATLVVGTADAMVPPVTSASAVERLQEAELVELEGLGHLAHEEAGERVAEVIAKVLR
ncbi:MAG: alpha/beta fold hydrolase BchO [Pseudomonadota bacterium]